MKNKYLIIIPFFLFFLDINSKSLASEVKIESDKVEFINNLKNVNFFNGEAEKILFFSDEKVHLVGNASIKFEKISINSNLIIFNPKTGKITSDN